MSSDSLARILAPVDQQPASYLRAAREIEQLGDVPELKPVRVSILSTITFDLVLPYFVVEGARRGLRIRPSVAPFGQLEQQVLDPSSALYSSDPELIVLVARVEEGAPELCDGFAGLATAQIEAAIDSHVDRIAGLVREARARSRAHIIVWNQPPPQRLAASFADPALDMSQQRAFDEVNRRLAVAARAIAGTHVFDAARLAVEVGLGTWFDRKLGYMGRVPFSGPAQQAVGARLARHTKALLTTPAKCLVLDLDNTLWGGVLGEDGVAGIQYGEEYPGNVYRAFQRVVKSFRDRGVLLAVASKNNEADVRELFARRSDMVLALDDFAALEIHWNDKASSMRAIAAALNIGVDSLAFFDDNPVEREWVRSQLPEVRVIDVPKEPLGYLRALDDCGAFDHLAITAEDRARAGLYRADARRREVQRTSGSLDDFLRTLEMEVKIGRVDDATRARVVQLLGKTNQFNVTTRRYGEADLMALLDREGAIGLWMRVTDRYGDNGLVGVAIAVRRDERLYYLDSFLMSCRVLGRNVEHALLDAVARRAARQGARTLVGEFLPTRKNAPAADFFSRTGFTKAADLWELDLSLPRELSPALSIVDEDP